MQHLTLMQVLDALSKSRYGVFRGIEVCSFYYSTTERFYIDVLDEGGSKHNVQVNFVFQPLRGETPNTMGIYQRLPLGGATIWIRGDLEEDICKWDVLRHELGHLLQHYAGTVKTQEVEKSLFEKYIEGRARGRYVGTSPKEMGAEWTRVLLGGMRFEDIFWATEPNAYGECTAYIRALMSTMRKREKIPEPPFEEYEDEFEWERQQDADGDYV
jgi:hypothetical protein